MFLPASSHVLCDCRYVTYFRVRIIVTFPLSVCFYRSIFCEFQPALGLNALHAKMGSEEEKDEKWPCEPIGIETYL